jgi:hypothetical protein
MMEVPGYAPPGRRTDLPIAEGELDADLRRTVQNTSYMRQGFYVVVLLVALAGQVSGAVQALKIPLVWAVPAVGALELGGIVVLANADVRRRLGEQAIASRLLSAVIAAGAVAFNWLAHPDHLLGGFFAGMSALGYLVWLMHTENQRRDRLRAKGDLPPTTPAYELLGHWLPHPWLTRRAKSMAKANPQLDLYGSLAAARAEIRRERRQAAISKVLHRKIRAAVDPNTADIALAVYDLDEIAIRLADGADYDGLTALIAVDLAPERLAPDPAALTTGRRARRALPASGRTAALPVVASDHDALPGPHQTTDVATSHPGQPSDPPSLGAASTGELAVTADLTATASPAAHAQSDATVRPDAAGTAPAGRTAASQSSRPVAPPPSAETQVLPPDVFRHVADILPRSRPSAQERNGAVERNGAGAAELDADRSEGRRGARAAHRPPEAGSADPVGDPVQPFTDNLDDAVTTEGSLRSRVHAALDAAVPPDEDPDEASLVGLVGDLLQLSGVERLTIPSYVQTWKRDRDASPAIGSGRKLQTVLPTQTPVRVPRQGQRPPAARTARS